MTVRAKVTCSAKTQRKNWDPIKAPFIYDYEFQAVTGSGSVENQNFFASTPSIQFKLTSIKEDLFIPGENYYLDFTAEKDTFSEPK